MYSHSCAKILAWGAHRKHGAGKNIQAEAGPTQFEVWSHNPSCQDPGLHRQGEHNISWQIPCPTPSLPGIELKPVIITATHAFRCAVCSWTSDAFPLTFLCPVLPVPQWPALLSGPQTRKGGSPLNHQWAFFSFPLFLSFLEVHW